MIQIFTDTSANLPAAYIQKYSLRVIPLTYFVDGVEAIVLVVIHGLTLQNELSFLSEIHR